MASCPLNFIHPKNILCYPHGHISGTHNKTVSPWISSNMLSHRTQGIGLALTSCAPIIPIQLTVLESEQLRVAAQKEGRMKVGISVAIRI
jgi:hypothetical protein